MREFFFNNKRISMSLLVMLLLSAIAFCFTAFFIHWGVPNHPFQNDVNQYYSYLNALFIDHDLSFTRNTQGYWLIETPIHKVVPKVTYGMAFFYSPFYLFAKLISGTESMGYGSAYAWCIHFGCIFYALTGLWFTRKTLLLYFNERTTSVVLLLLFFGTNLFYYTLAESESVHGVLFFLISVFLYHVLKWHRSNNKTNFLLFCLAGGFICLIRPTEGLVLLIPMLIGIKSPKDIKVKIEAFFSLKWTFMAGILLFLLPLFPQLIYWKIQSDKFFFFSYGNSEGFFWNDPQIMNVFFSFRKGFFIYTPIMFFSIIGFYHLYKKNRDIFLPVLLYFIINSYLICCWWDWSYGGSFGMRTFIHCFAVLALPFSYFIDYVIELYKKGVAKTYFVYFIGVLSVFFCCLNILQSNLYKHQIIHYDGMNKKAYQYTFLKKRYTKEELEYLTTLFKSPDYAARRKGSRDE